METSPKGQIGRYVIQSELGRGAMGIVYRAQDPTIGRTVAIKTIRIHQFTDEREIQHVQDRMLREAQAAGILSHPNIVTIYDILQESGTAYIFMEFIDGDTLERLLLAEVSPEPEFVLQLLRQAAAALDYAHQKGIIHRDVKPANIMVSRDGTAKIADFGVARVQSNSMTQAGQVLGTPNYMSPEQISGKKVDGKADQYSLAVMLYELLTGEKPFVADSLPTLFFRVVSEPPQPVPRLNPTLNDGIDTVLQRGLAKNPEDRFPNCLALVNALEEACRNSPGWTPLPRGGGLSQPTQMGEAPQPEPKPAPQPEPKAATVAAPELPKRRESAEKPRPKPAFRPVPVIVTAVLVALLSGAAIFLKLRADRTAPAEEPTATVAQNTPQSTSAKSEPETPKPAPPKTTTTQAPMPLEGSTSRPQETPAQPQSTQPQSIVPAPVAGLAVAIRSTPEGASVTIDEGRTPPCTTPCLVELPKGRHTVSMSLATYAPEFRIFYVPENTAVEVALEKQKGTLAVNSTPPGAVVTIDGVEQNQRTPARFPVIVGKHTVVVSLPGHAPYTQAFEMRPEATISLHPNWAN